jgi:anti-sigma factor RsiW
MQCEESKKILDAYVDNEVDVVQSVALEEHLADCPDCSKTVQARRALRNAIQDSNLRYTAPPELAKSVRKSLHLPVEKAPSPVWQWFKPAFAGFATATAICAVIMALILHQLRFQPGPELASLVIDEHVRSLQEGTNHLMDVASSNQHVVKPWFQGKISFSPKVTDFTDKGFPLAGGRLDRLDNRDVAALVYKRYQHVINVFIYPSTENAGPKTYQERGYNVVSWSQNGMEYYVVSDLNLGELQQFVEMVRE